MSTLQYIYGVILVKYIELVPPRGSVNQWHHPPLMRTWWPREDLSRQNGPTSANPTGPLHSVKHLVSLGKIHHTSIRWPLLGQTSPLFSRRMLPWLLTSPITGANLIVLIYYANLHFFAPDVCSRGGKRPDRCDLIIVIPSPVTKSGQWS